jgi:hypothetical protein
MHLCCALPTNTLQEFLTYSDPLRLAGGSTGRPGEGQLHMSTVHAPIA